MLAHCNEIHKSKIEVINLQLQRKFGSEAATQMTECIDLVDNSIGMYYIIHLCAVKTSYLTRAFWLDMAFLENDVH